MAHPYHHALSSVKKWGGTVDDFITVHAWLMHRNRSLRIFGTGRCATMPYPDSMEASYSCAWSGLCVALGLRDEPAPARSPSKGP